MNLIVCQVILIEERDRRALCSKHFHYGYGVRKEKEQPEFK